MSTTPFPGLSNPVLEHGTYMGIEWQVQQGPLSLTGYVKLPDGHPWIGKDLILGEGAPDVHGGITFDEGNIVGFDCNHFGDMYHPDSPDTALILESMGGVHDFGAHLWTQPEVVAEVKRLAVQAATEIMEEL